MALNGYGLAVAGNRKLPARLPQANPPLNEGSDKTANLIRFNTKGRSRRQGDEQKGSLTGLEADCYRPGA
jgi:hypothetical protein